MCEMASSRVYVSMSLLLGLTLLSPYLVAGRFTTEQIDHFGKACNASQEDLAVTKLYKVPTTETGKCLMRCMINKLGLLNDNGTYNKTGTEEALKKYWSEWTTEQISQINNKCYEEAQKVSPEVVETCTYAYEVIACINTQSKILGLLNTGS